MGVNAEDVPQKRGGQDLVGRASADDPAGGQDVEAVAVGQRQVEVVERDEYGDLHLSYELQHVERRPDVEMVGGLVEHEQP